MKTLNFTEDGEVLAEFKKVFNCLRKDGELDNFIALAVAGREPEAAELLNKVLLNHSLKEMTQSEIDDLLKKAGNIRIFQVAEALDQIDKFRGTKS